MAGKAVEAAAHQSMQELIADARVLEQWLQEEEGEETPTLAALWEEVHGGLHAKVERWGWFLTTGARRIEDMKQLEQLLAARRKAMEARLAASKDYLGFKMLEAGIVRVEGAGCTVAFQLNNPAVDGDVPEPVLRAWLAGEDEEARTLVRHTETFALDRTAALAKLKAGEAIQFVNTDGATESLALVRTQSLRIRVANKPAED